MAEDFVIEKFAFKMLLRGVGIVLLVAALLYPLDFAVWRVRVAAGGGMAPWTVDLYTVADLKGGKERLLREWDGGDAVHEVPLSAGRQQALLVGGAASRGRAALLVAALTQNRLKDATGMSCRTGPLRAERQLRCGQRPSAGRFRWSRTTFSFRPTGGPRDAGKRRANTRSTRRGLLAGQL